MKSRDYTSLVSLINFCQYFINILQSIMKAIVENVTSLSAHSICGCNIFESLPL